MAGAPAGTVVLGDAVARGEAVALGETVGLGEAVTVGVAVGVGDTVCANATPAVVTKNDADKASAASFFMISPPFVISRSHFM